MHCSIRATRGKVTTIEVDESTGIIVTTQPMRLIVTEEVMERAQAAKLRLTTPFVIFNLDLDPAAWSGYLAKQYAVFASLVTNGYYNERSLAWLIDSAEEFGVKLSDAIYQHRPGIKPLYTVVAQAEIFLASTAIAPEGWEATSDERKMK